VRERTSDRKEMVKSLAGEEYLIERIKCILSFYQEDFCLISPPLTPAH